MTGGLYDKAWLSVLFALACLVGCALWTMKAVRVTKEGQE